MQPRCLYYIVEYPFILRSLTPSHLKFYLILNCVCFVLMCLKPRQFVDSSNRDVNYVTFNKELDCCDYVDYGDAIPVDSNELVIMQLNVCELYSKIDQIKSLLNVVTSNRTLDILMLCETW